MTESALTAWNNSEERIKRAVKRKRRQGRNAGTPSVSPYMAKCISTTHSRPSGAADGVRNVAAAPTTYIGVFLRVLSVFSRLYFIMIYDDSRNGD